MNTVVAGRFADQANARQAVGALAAAGFDRGRIASMHVDAANVQDLHEPHADPDTTATAAAEADGAETGAVNGTLAGIGVGTVVGLATLPFLGPVAPFAGAAVGAYVGSFAGVLEGIDEAAAHATPAEGVSPDDNPATANSAVLVAVGASSPTEHEKAITVMRAHGAASLESVEGNIADGRWKDLPQRG